MLWPVFVAVFLAELGDTPPLAPLLFAADQRVSQLGAFVASAAALMPASLIAVLVGAQLSPHVSQRMLRLMARLGFIVIGIWVLFDARSS